jgi:soluble lytic murein transglycosylase-like protein
MTQLFVVVLLVCVAAANAAEAQAVPMRGAEMQRARYYARQYAVPTQLVMAIIDVESNWQPYAVSDKGAAGLMQLLPATAYRFGVRNRFVVEENIRGGVAYLAQLMHRFGGDLRLVAAAYYAGERRIEAVGLNCADSDVYRYVTAVECRYRRRLISGSDSVPGNQGATGE